MEGGIVLQLFKAGHACKNWSFVVQVMLKGLCSSVCLFLFGRKGKDHSVHAEDTAKPKTLVLQSLWHMCICFVSVCADSASQTAVYWLSKLPSILTECTW